MKQKPGREKAPGRVIDFSRIGASPAATIG